MKSKLALVALILMGLAFPNTTFAEGSAKPVAEEGKPIALKVDVPQPAATPAEARELAMAWIMSFMTKHAPPGRKTYYVEAQETKEVALKRYKSIASDIVEVIYNKTTKPIFKGANGRARTISIVLGIMLFESGFGRNVDFGVGKFARGDNGNSWCLMQLNVGKGRPWTRAGGWNIVHERPWRWGDKKEDLIPGASGSEMVKDRRLCITEGLRLVRLSFRSCIRRPFKERLNVYASGRCTAGQKGSRIRMTAAIKMYKHSYNQRKLFKDADVMTAVDDILVKRKADEAKAKALAAAEVVKAKVLAAAEAGKGEGDKPKDGPEKPVKAKKEPVDKDKPSTGQGAVASNT